MQHHSDNATDTGLRGIWEAWLFQHCSYPVPMSPSPSINPYLASRSSTSITVMDPWFAPMALLPPAHSTWNNTGQRLGIKLCPHSGHGQNSHRVTKQLIQFWIKAKIKIWTLLILCHLMPRLWNPFWLLMDIRMLVKSYLIPSHCLTLLLFPHPFSGAQPKWAFGKCSFCYRERKMYVTFSYNFWSWSQN